MEATKEPRGQELVDRYKANFHIPSDSSVTEEMILQHWELEKSLTKELLDSSPDNRWDVFERCYSILYSELDWLNEAAHTGDEKSDDWLYGDWGQMVGAPPKHVYEVGSGKGKLVHYLARLGHKCVGTEITRERGKSVSADHPNLRWAITDGVHLDRFETPASFDVVISDQVIEHLHPDDVIDHFEGAYAILKPGGRYIFATPHTAYGPMDVTRVFGYDTPMGMHLKEYDYKEIVSLLKRAGFNKVMSPLRLPRKVRRVLRGHPKVRPSRLYLIYLMILERLLALLPSQSVRRRAAQFGRLVLFDGVWIVAEK